MLDLPIGEIWKIEDVYQQRLHRLGIDKVRDLFFHFPYHYFDYSKITPISELKYQKEFLKFEKKDLILRQKNIYCIIGVIKTIKTIQSKFKKIKVTEAVIEGVDKKHRLRVVWFNQSYLSQYLKPATKIALAGKLSPQKILISPDYEIITDKELIHTCRLVPAYPVTRGLSSKWYRYILKPFLDESAKDLIDPIPEEIKEKQNLLSLKVAIQEIHFPSSVVKADQARFRFCFEELFLIQCHILKVKKEIEKQKSFKFKFNLKKTKKLLSALPFELTQDQKIATWEIIKDFKKNYPMNRLLQGDVGSGKTVVAIIASLNIIDNGQQVALMAPTEILAVQHFESISNMLKEFKINIGLLTSKNSKAFISGEIVNFKKPQFFEKVKNQKIDLLIGTHSLISKPNSKNSLGFKKLGLVILDEQHRFGVGQRSNLLKLSKKTIPHSLSLTATPIPRTLTLTVYGDLNFSIIREMPKGRKIVITKNVPAHKRKDAYDFIEKRVNQGEQVFVICPRIETKSDSKPGSSEYFIHVKKFDDVKTVVEEYQKLSKKIFPNLRISMLHGKIKSKEKQEILANFRNKKSDILVSTSVIEVGIDIPNATIIMIEGAELFGLAQLHQLRGRVGRSDKQSYCLLFSGKEAVSSRLRAMEKISNGFDLAEKDLKIRGPGDFVGNRQWGVADITMSALTDLDLIKKTRDSALEILQKSPDLMDFPELKKRLDSFQKKIHLE